MSGTRHNRTETRRLKKASSFVMIVFQKIIKLTDQYLRQT